MPHVKSKINNHNKTILQNSAPKTIKKCSYIEKGNFPMNRACLTSNVLYYTIIMEIKLLRFAP